MRVLVAHRGESARKLPSQALFSFKWKVRTSVPLIYRQPRMKLIEDAGCPTSLDQERSEQDEARKFNKLLGVYTRICIR